MIYLYLDFFVELTLKQIYVELNFAQIRYLQIQND